MRNKPLLITFLVIPFTLVLADRVVPQPMNTPIVVIGNKGHESKVKEQQNIDTPPSNSDPGTDTPDLQAEQPEKKLRITTLRVEGSPQGEFIKYRATYPTLVKVTIAVRNVGSETADSVVVSVILPDGETVPLVGPGSLKRNEKALYSRPIRQQIKSNNPLRAKLECTNCRTRQ